MGNVEELLQDHALHAPLLALHWAPGEWQLQSDPCMDSSGLVVWTIIPSLPDAWDDSVRDRSYTLSPIPKPGPQTQKDAIS